MSSKNRTTATKDVAKPLLVPQLRFPEFHGVALRSVQLGEVTEEGRRRNGKKHSAASVMGVTKADGIVPMEARIVAADIERYKLVEHDWFAYNPMRLNIGSIARWKGEREILVSPDYVVFKCVTNDGSGIAPGYFDHLRQTKAWEDFVNEGGDGGVRVRIYYKDIARLQLALPSLPEQQRIAECLSSVDEMRAAQARKVDALNAHKKGLMQQLFPCEGETQPRLRFPEFQNAGEWVGQSVGDFGKVVTGSTPSTAKLAFYGGGIPFVSPADISDLRFVAQTKTTLTADGFAETRPIRAGSILFVCIGSTIGKVAQNVHDCATNQQINAVVPSAEYSDGFVYFALSFASERIALLAGKQAVPIINKSLFSSVRLLVPKLPEQQRIASCLSSLDALIAAETQKLKALKTHKKGLMQQLFPSPEGVDT
jgi:type I restriction enzyme S subunit